MKFRSSISSSEKRRSAWVFWGRLMALALLVGVCQWFVGRLGEAHDVPEIVKQVDAVISTPADIIYLGDSTLYTGRLNDQRTIPEMLRDLMPECTVAQLYHGGFGMSMYRRLVKYFGKKGYKPAVIVVPINLRVMSAPFYWEPGLQFPEEKAFLAHNAWFLRLFYRPMAIFKAFDLTPVDNDEFSSAVEEECGKLGVDCRADVLGSGIRLREFTFTEEGWMRLLYLQVFDESHPAVADLLAVAKAGERAGTKVLFYFTPIDYQALQAEVDPNAAEILERNVSFVRSLLAGRDAEVADLTMLVESAQFGRLMRITEHLADGGRLAVAQALASYIREHGLTAQGGATATAHAVQP